MLRVLRLTLAILASVALFVLSPGSSALAAGEDAVALPKGLSRLFVDTRFFLPFENRYDQNGDSVPFGRPLSLNLNNSVFTALPAGATLGQSNVSIERHVTEMTIQPAYGLTDRLTIGANIPYTWYENQVNASINTTGFTVGCTAPGGGVVGGASPASVACINNTLNAQFGLKPIQTYSDSGVGDIEVGAKYQYYRAEDFRAAVTGGVRFPTGKMDDPDNLVDSKLGDGTYALGIRLQQDYMRQAEGLGKRLGFPNPGEFFINTTVGYDYNLPDTRTLRVCGTAFACTTKDDVHTKIGDVAQAQVSGKFGLPLRGWIFTPLYFYSYKFKDHYSGDRNLDYGALNQQFDRMEQTEHIFILTLTYTTIPLVLEKKFPLPLVFEVSYRDRFSGSGGKGDSQYIGFTLQSFFWLYKP